jgi:hypothetical protein
MKKTLTASIFDALAAADTFEIAHLDIDDERVTYRIAFRITVDRDSYSNIVGEAEKQGRSVVATLRRRIQKSFKFCFGVENPDTKET